MSFLLDTNVISELRKGRRADVNVMSWVTPIDADDLFLSVLTLSEIRRGIERVARRDAAQARVLEAWLQRVLRQYGPRLMVVDAAVADTWGRVSATTSLPVVDGLLAATAIVHGLTVATRNVKDIRRTGVPVINPFQHVA